MIKNCNLLILRPPERTSKLQEKPSALKREHQALKKIKNINFFQFFGIANLDSVQRPIEFRSTTLHRGLTES
jgi:hypothetical protein